MTSNPPLAPDISRGRDKDASSNSPLGRRNIVSASSHSSPRYSLSSSQAGESSTAATTRNHPTVDGIPDEVGGWETRRSVGLHSKDPIKGGGGSYRSHKGRSSGGFLLSDSFLGPSSHTPERLPYQRPSARNATGKALLGSPRNQHMKQGSNAAVGQGDMVSAANTKDLTEEATHKNGDGVDGGVKTQPPAARLDADSAKIVNLALNLSESRRNARRNISTPLPPITQGPREGFAGGSLRQHLQQQRRLSRNASPKADRAGRAATASPRIASSTQVHSPLQAAFDAQPDRSYQYQFSPSTLARAAKAKNAIELMAEYRRLLQYVPPLKPQLEQVTSNDTTTTPPSPASASVSRSVSVSSRASRPPGRSYNPLQYIRNRKVRARNAKAIDGESQGFGDLSKVSSWVDRVSIEASSEGSHLADCLSMPSFSKAADAAASPHTSPQSGSGPASGKGQAVPPKVKRPRIDWVTNPADMIADVFWLEQDDNKKMIENRHGGKIFPPTAELKRPVSRRGEVQERQLSSGQALKEEAPALNLQTDTKLPDFKPIKADLDKHTDSTASRARQKLRHVRNSTRMHNHNGSIHDRSHIFRSHSISHSDSSDSDAERQPARRRSGTIDSNDRGRDILEKQMMEMLQREAKEADRKPTHDFINDPIVHSSKALKPMPEAFSETVGDGPGHLKSGSLVNKRKIDAVKNGSSGRASLEVPSSSPKRSLEELDSTAPNSPEVRASKFPNTFVPSLAMNFSPPRSRNTSQTRNPLSKVKSKILPFGDHSLEQSRSRVTMEEPPIQVQLLGSKDQTPTSPDTPERRRRSMSPPNLTPSRKDEGGLKPLKNTSSVRKGKGEDSGIRGLFKSSRNPVARVGELLWKSAKEPSPDLGVSSSFSTDESDVEDFRVPQAPPVRRYSRGGPAKSESQDTSSLTFHRDIPSYINDMPIFSSSERRGRPVRAKGEEVTMDSERQDGAALKKPRLARMPEPTPRIDVQIASPTASPERDPTTPSHRDPSASDQDSRGSSFVPDVESADARLNAILGLPGKRRNALPVTGLANLDVTHDQGSSHIRKRQWSISDRGVSIHRGPMTKREIDRVQALLLSSGIKAKEISRRAAELRELGNTETYYSDIAKLAQKHIAPVPRGKQHLLAARILSSDIQLSSRMWQESADTFTNTTITGVLTNIENLQTRLSNDLTPMARKAADEADDVSKDLVTSQTLTVKKITDKINTMMRRRRRRFRWLRRGGWVLLEWALVGVMWCVWFVVVLARVVMGVGRGAVGSVRWLFWL